jgi:hypothetical protein
MKKIFGLVIAALLLTACTSVETEASSLETSGGVMVTPIRTIEAAVPILEEAMIPYPYYYTVWDYCIVDGKRIDNLTFTWTDLGMSMVVDKEVIYLPNLQERITECRGTLIEG